MIQKVLSKLKMKTIITSLSILACILIVLMGGNSSINSMRMLNKANYIYSYQGYTNIISTIQSSFLAQKVSILEVTAKNNQDELSNIEAMDKIIRANIDEYNSTEYEDAEEEQNVKIMSEAYYEYYELIQKVLTANASKEVLDPADSARIGELETTISEYLDILTNYLLEWAESDMKAAGSDYNSIITFNIVLFSVSLILFGCLTFAVVRFFNKEVKIIVEALKKASSGDLTIDVMSYGETEFSQMKQHLNQTIQNFLVIIDELKEQSYNIEEQSNDLSDSSNELSASIANISDSISTVRTSTEMQACDIEETVSILNTFSEEMTTLTSNIETLNNNSNEITNIATQSTEKMDVLASSFSDINTMLTSFIEKIGALDHAVSEISSITTFINSIAAQTNLLALNASIESARVGEAGKGFAVVASEIGTLAEQSREASNNISSLIAEVASDTSEIMNQSNDVMSKLASSMSTIDDSMDTFKPMFNLLDEIVSKIASLNKASARMTEEKDIIYDKMRQTAELATEISSSTDEITNPLSEITQISQDVASTSVGLHDLTSVLDNNINRFTTR